MQSFLQYLLTEAPRSSERAVSILHRIAKSKRFGGGEVPGAINSLVPHSGHYYGGGGYTPDRLDPTRNKEYHQNTINGNDYEFSHIEHIPVKSLKSAQDRVSIPGVERQVKNPDQRKDLPKVFRVEKDGGEPDHIIRDGHHGASAARLRGDTHIQAKIYVKKKQGTMFE